MREILVKVALVLVVFCFFGIRESMGQVNYEELRDLMVQGQIAARGVKDKSTLKAMRTVPRHLFVPDNAKRYAYRDSPLSIGEGQTISQPYIVAFMTSELRLRPTDRVLEIGTGSGYQAAVLSEIVDSVFTMEIVEPLGIASRERLSVLGYNNVEVRIGDGYHGWPEKGPFDAIMVTAGAQKIPQALVEQLKEGGSIIIPVGASHYNSQLVLGKKVKGKLKTRNRMPVSFVPFTRDNDSTKN